MIYPENKQNELLEKQFYQRSCYINTNNTECDKTFLLSDALPIAHWPILGQTFPIANMS